MNMELGRSARWAGVVVISAGCWLPSLGQEARGSRPLSAVEDPARWYADSHALIISASDYTAGWPNLPSIPDELAQLESSLREHGFTIERVENPDGDELAAALRAFVQDFGYGEANRRLLVFFSGHGHTEVTTDGRQRGYLVPTDAPLPTESLEEFKRRALAMEDVLNEARKIEGKHVLFVFDSCFSGSVVQTKSAPAVAPPPFVVEQVRLPVRHFITAGSADEEVPAESLFTPELVTALTGLGDLDGNGYLTGTELGMYLRRKIINYGVGLTPQSEKINDPRLNAGEFVFVVGGEQLPPAGDPLATGPREQYRTVSLVKEVLGQLGKDVGWVIGAALLAFSLFVRRLTRDWRESHRTSLPLPWRVPWPWFGHKPVGSGDPQIERFRENVEELEASGSDELTRARRLVAQLVGLFERAAFEEHPLRTEGWDRLLYAVTATDLVLREHADDFAGHEDPERMRLDTSMRELGKLVRAYRKIIRTAFGGSFDLARHIDRYARSKQTFLAKLPPPDEAAIADVNRWSAAEEARLRVEEKVRELRELVDGLVAS